MKMKTPSSIKDYITSFDEYSNEYDMLSYGQIEDYKRNKICRQHNLPEGTDIYYFRKYSSDWIFVICELGVSIYYLDDESNEYYTLMIPWKDIERVEYDREDSLYNIYLNNDSDPISLDCYRVTKFSDKENQFANLLTMMASTVVDEVIQYVSRFDRLITEDKYGDVYDLGRCLLNGEYGEMSKEVREHVCNEMALNNYVLALNEEDNEKNRELLQEALGYICEYLDSTSDPKAVDFFMKARIAALLGSHYIHWPILLYVARPLLIMVMEDENKELAENARKLYNTVTDQIMKHMNDFENLDARIREVDDNTSLSIEEKKEYKENIVAMTKSDMFTSNDVSDRKFLMFVKDSYAIAGCNDSEDNISYVFTVDTYPKDIVFPLGHPQANTLYMAHSILDRHYLPCNRINEVLFLEKVRDFCYIAQCLGATKINCKVIKGSTTNVDTKGITELHSEVGRKLVNIEGTINTHNQEYKSNVRGSEQEWEYTFDPIDKPYCPDDSVWLNSDASWQQMVKMRLYGNQLSFVERISSSETLNMTSSQKSSVEASFSTLLWKVSGGVKSDSDVSIFRKEDCEYEISVIFKPLNEYKEVKESDDVKQIAQQQSMSHLSPDEEKYKEEILFCLEDNGCLNETDRKYLDRKRIKLGLSEERAKAIESMCLPSITPEEQEYIDFIREYFEDGEIGPRERRLLDRERQSLGISEQRAKELENQVLTDSGLK